MGLEEIGRALSSRGKRPRLMEFIKQHGIVFRHVKLSSNKETDYYYDIKGVASHPKGLHLLSELLLEKIVEFGPKSVGGLEIGSIPLTIGVVMKSVMNEKYRKGINGFVIRKNPKTHGLEKKIEGLPEEPIVILDDVITSGQSVKDAIDALNQARYSVKGVVCVIDREEDGTVNVLKEHRIKYSSIFKHSDFKPFIEENLKTSRR